MEKQEHAERIVNALYTEYFWETVEWTIIDKPIKYHLVFTSEDITLEYEIDLAIAPGIYAEGIAKGFIGPVRSHSKAIDEFEQEFIKALPRKLRRAVQRKLKKS